MHISEARKKFNEHYDLWQSSGFSMSEYCRQNGLTYSWFASHLKNKRKEEQVSTSFERIETAKQLEQTGASIEFHFPDGRYFVFGSGTPFIVIRNLTL